MGDTAMTGKLRDTSFPSTVTVSVMVLVPGAWKTGDERGPTTGLKDPVPLHRTLSERSLP